jgi:hypothetical protein
VRKTPWLPDLANEAGQSLILVILLVDAVVLGALWFFMHFTEQQANARVNFVKRFLLEETVSSSFEVMEAALRRRLWESPPDSNCLRSTDFRVDGLRSELKLQWNVIAKYNASTHVYDLTATGGYYSDPITKAYSRGLKAVFHKQIKVLDASDFLMLNMGSQTLNVTRTYESSGPAGLVAGPKRIYMKGPMTLYSLELPNVQAHDWTPTGANFNYFGTIIQGERIQIAGGIRYQKTYTVQPPDPASCASLSPLCGVLAPYVNNWIGQSTGAGVFYGANEYTAARNLNDAIKACHGDNTCTPPPTSGVDLNDVIRHTYPIALFDNDTRSRPLTVGASPVDNRRYVNNPYERNVFLYSFTANHWGMAGDYTCLTDASVPGAECSFSEAYPKGFGKWRTDAGLDGVLFTHETEDIAAAPMDWDNFQAMKEDAQACGKVVDAGAAPAYEDCPIWDRNFLNSYVASHGASVPACHKITKVSLDGSIFPNFHEADYANDALKDRLLRRIIYAKGPIEIAQTNVKGLRPAMTDPKVRGRLSIWIVGEDYVTLRGNQDADNTPPAPGSYDRLRKVTFNADGTAPNGGGFPSLRMVLMTPELVHLVSPQYVPMSTAHFLDSYKVKNGYLWPRIPAMFDEARAENDGYVWGLRSFQLRNMVTIANASQPASLLSAEDGFFLKGMWSAWDSSAEQFIHNQCLFNVDGGPAFDPRTDGVHCPTPAHDVISPPNSISNQWCSYTGNYVADAASVRTDDGVHSHVPPLSSKFYQTDASGEWVPWGTYPYVFSAQAMTTQASNGTRESNIQYSGLRLQVKFDPTHSATQRDLSVSKYATAEMAAVNLSDRKYFWDLPYYWQNIDPAATPGGAACTRQTIHFLDGTLSYIPASDYDYVNNYLHVNFGKHVFQHSSPDANLTDMGSLFGVDLPMVESRE